MERVVRVGHGCDTKAATGVELKLPPGVTALRAQARAGWQVALTPQQVTWLALPGPRLRRRQRRLPAGAARACCRRNAMAEGRPAMRFGQRGVVASSGAGSDTSGMKNPAVLLQVMSAAEAAAWRMRIPLAPNDTPKGIAEVVMIPVGSGDAQRDPRRDRSSLPILAGYRGHDQRSAAVTTITHDQWEPYGPVEVRDELSMIDFLREYLGLTGTKFGCGVAQCLSCAVIVDNPDGTSQTSPTCIVPAVSFAGKSIRTVEGHAQNGQLSALQKAFVEHFSFQCGYCTAGFLNEGQVLLERLAKSRVSRAELDQTIVDALDGIFAAARATSNIMRPCATYSPIRRATSADGPTRDYACLPVDVRFSPKVTRLADQRDGRGPAHLWRRGMATA